MNELFWSYLERLIEGSEIVIDRPRKSSHPRYPGKVYPVDYGYLQGTTSSDHTGVDIWVGTLGGRQIAGVLCTVDLLKRDTELKVVYDCSEAEIEAIKRFVDTDQMQAIFIKR